MEDVEEEKYLGVVIDKDHYSMDINGVDNNLSLVLFLLLLFISNKNY